VVLHTQRHSKGCRAAETAAATAAGPAAACKHMQTAAAKCTAAPLQPPHLVMSVSLGSSGTGEGLLLLPAGVAGGLGDKGLGLGLLLLLSGVMAGAGLAAGGAGDAAVGAGLGLE
jgi:hypothetical protein